MATTEQVNDKPTLTDKLKNRSTAMTAEVKPRSVADELKLYFEKRGDEYMSSIPKSLGLTAERLTRLAITEIRSTPALLECTKESLMAAIIKSFQLGLEIGSHLGMAYLVPFNNKVKGGRGEEDKWVKQVQLIIGYKGVLALARRSGDIESIGAHTICENDEFEQEYGWNDKLRHKPAFPDRGKPIGAYAYCTTKSGGRYCEVMNLAEIEKIKNSSKASKFGPWVDWWDEMARKSVAKRLCKWLPLSTELMGDLADDDSDGDGGGRPAIMLTEIVPTEQKQVVAVDSEQATERIEHVETRSDFVENLADVKTQEDPFVESRGNVETPKQQEKTEKRQEPVREEPKQQSVVKEESKLRFDDHGRPVNEAAEVVVIDTNGKTMTAEQADKAVVPGPQKSVTRKTTSVRTEKPAGERTDPDDWAESFASINRVGHVMAEEAKVRQKAVNPEEIAAIKAAAAQRIADIKGSTTPA